MSVQNAQTNQNELIDKSRFGAMLLFPPIFHGVLGFFLVSIIAMSLFVFPEIFAEEWEIKIVKGASLEEPTELFFPNELSFVEGDTIKWINEDSVIHHITSGLPKFPDYYGYFFDVGVINPGKSSSITIDEKENDAYYYLCEIHPWMTGKLFLSTAFTAQAETENPLSISKQSFSKGESAMVKGTVHQDFWGTKYQLQIFNDKNKLVNVIHGKFDDKSNFEQKITTDYLDASGTYKIKLVYALPSKVSQTSFEFSNDSILNDPNVPIWIKNVGKLWCKNQITDYEFLSALEYLVTNDIINVDSKVKIYADKKGIPNWVKNNTCWWSESKISDIEFLTGIEHLINSGIIKA